VVRKVKLPSDKPLSREMELELAKRYKETGDRLAAHRLILSNTGMVHKVAHRFKRYKVPFADLVQEGYKGVMHGLKKFDPDKGYRLATYVSWWIRAYMTKFIINQWSIVRFGTTQEQRVSFFKYQRGDLPKDDTEIRLAMGDFHLDAPLSDSSLLTHMDMLRCDSAEPDEEATLNETHLILRSTIADMLDSMSRHERMLIRYRFLTHNPWPLDKLAKKLGISRQRLHQVEVRLKKKLRERLVLEGLG
jgi:RNA polymerase sigma-32 factor